MDICKTAVVCQCVCYWKNHIKKCFCCWNGRSKHRRRTWQNSLKTRAVDICNRRRLSVRLLLKKTTSKSVFCCWNGRSKSKASQRYVAKLNKNSRCGYIVYNWSSNRSLCGRHLGGGRYRKRLQGEETLLECFFSAIQERSWSLYSIVLPRISSARREPSHFFKPNCGTTTTTMHQSVNSSPAQQSRARYNGGSNTPWNSVNSFEGRKYIYFVCKYMYIYVYIVFAIYCICSIYYHTILVCRLHYYTLYDNTRIIIKKTHTRRKGRTLMMWKVRTEERKQRTKITRRT